MSKIKVLDTFVRGTNNVIEADLDQLYIYWMFEGLKTVKVVGKDNKVTEVNVVNILNKYDSPLMAMYDVCKDLTRFANVLGFPVNLVSGGNVLVGKNMKKPTKVDLSSFSHPVILINPKLFRGVDALDSVFNNDYRVSKGLNTVNMEYTAYGYLVEGVGNYLYDVFISNKVKGKQKEMPIYLTREEFADGFVILYSDYIFKRLPHGKNNLVKFGNLRGEMNAFIRSVKTLN